MKLAPVAYPSVRFDLMQALRDLADVNQQETEWPNRKDNPYSETLGLLSSFTWTDPAQQYLGRVLFGQVEVDLWARLHDALKTSIVEFDSEDLRDLYALSSWQNVRELAAELLRVVKANNIQYGSEWQSAIDMNV